MNTHRYVNLLILLSIQYCITNVFEKVFVQQYIGEYKRPDSEKNRSASSLGMPSGHVETTTILCFILEYYNVISIEVAIFIIIVMALQRVLSKRHTPEQTMMGFFMGRKQCCEKIRKFGEVSSVLHRQHKIFYYSYKDLEADLYIFSEKIKSHRIDCIVGIKTGGAILASYLAKKLNKPYYFIKPENKKYMRKTKSDFNIFTRAYIYRMHHKDKHAMEMLEIITDDIKNQHVLLIDESVGTGSTMDYSIDYLYKEKGVSKVSSYIFEKNSLKFNSVIDDKITIWPWGFDN